LYWNLDLLQGVFANVQIRKVGHHTSAIASVAYPSCGGDFFGIAGVLEGLVHAIRCELAQVIQRFGDGTRP
jgi:ABC-type thiamin/hydroxymethylpyrimidine transport system permease subunit